MTGVAAERIIGASVEGHTDINNSQVGGGSYETAPKQGSFFPSTDPSPAPAQPGEDMHRGWVKLWRKWRDHEMASDPNATLVFLHLLTEARRTPKKNRRYGYTLERGQCDLTISQLSKLTGLTTKSVRGALERLGRYETISRGIQQGKQPAIITIVNFDRYNPDVTPEGNHTGDQGGTTRAPKGQLPEKVEKGREKENTTSPPASRSKPRKPHWSEPHGTRLSNLTDCPSPGPWAFLNKLAREHTEQAVLSALAKMDRADIANWTHARGWLTEVAKSAHRTVPASDDYEDRLD